MERFAGITISAVVVFLGCALAVLFVGFMGLGIALMSVQAGQAPPVPLFMPFAMGMIVLTLALAGWGIASGVGLLKLREWARVSMLIFSGLLIFFTLPAGLVFAWIRFPVPSDAQDPEFTARIMSLTHIFISLVYFSLAALGGFWLYYFLKKSVREQFSVAALLYSH